MARPVRRRRRSSPCVTGTPAADDRAPVVLDGPRHRPGPDPHRPRDPRAQQGRRRPRAARHPDPRRPARPPARRPDRRGRGRRPSPVGSLDVTMYRDDLRLRPARALRPHRDPGRRHRRHGRRPRRRRALLRPHDPRRARRAAATSAGPRAVQLAVLVDRGHRELPIRADYVGKNLPDLARASGSRVQLDRASTATDAVTRSTADAATARRRPMKRTCSRAADLTRDDADAGPRHRRARCARWPDRPIKKLPDPARPHRRQPVLRGLHPHPDLVRGRGQAAVGRRHQLLGQGLAACPRARASRTPR